MSQLGSPGSGFSSSRSGIPAEILASEHSICAIQRDLEASIGLTLAFKRGIAGGAISTWSLDRSGYFCPDSFPGFPCCPASGLSWFHRVVFYPIEAGTTEVWTSIIKSVRPRTWWALPPIEIVAAGSDTLLRKCFASVGCFHFFAGNFTIPVDVHTHHDRLVCRGTSRAEIKPSPSLSNRCMMRSTLSKVCWFGRVACCLSLSSDDPSSTIAGRGGVAFGFAFDFLLSSQRPAIVSRINPVAATTAMIL